MPVRLAPVAVALAAVLLCASAAARPTTSAAIAAERGGPAATAVATTLPVETRAALDHAGLPADALVVWVQAVDSPRPRLAWRADRPVNPASLTKLVTTYAALDLLGPAWTWRTPVWLQGSVHDGVLDGNLVIQGSGDPKLVVERLWLMLRRVRQMGVQQIRGDIVLDRSAFVLPPHHAADFDGEPLRPYNVGADALLLNLRSLVLTVSPDPARGIATLTVEPALAGVQVDASVPLDSGAVCGDWRSALGAQFGDPARIRMTGRFPLACGERSWALAYADPSGYDARLLYGLWNELGGSLDGSVRDGSAPTGPPSFVLDSPSLPEVVRDINKFSNNVMAQQLFLTLGWTQRGSGTPALARAALRQWLGERLGADALAGLVLDNGSGLSRETRLSARTLGRLLGAAWSSPVMPELLASLPVSGLDGTALRSQAGIGRAHLKTGSLRDVRGVAGYVLADSGRRYVVVAILNDAHASDDAARAPIDALLQWVAADAPPGAPAR